MKITEPKTPYVRYNAETDEFEGGRLSSFLLTTTWTEGIADIPDLDLGGKFPDSPTHSFRSISPTGADASGPSSRRTSISSSGRANSVSGRSASTASSRSTSFNLPDDARSDIRSDDRPLGEEVEFGEEMDEESQSHLRYYGRAKADWV